MRVDHGQVHLQIECSLAWSVLLSTTSMRHHSGQNVVTNFVHLPLC